MPRFTCWEATCQDLYSDVLVIYCSIKNYPRFKSLKQHVFITYSCLGKESRCDLARSSVLCSNRAASKVSAGAAVRSWERIHCQAHLLGCWWESVPPGLKASVSLWLLAGGLNSLPCGFLHSYSLLQQLASHKKSKKRQRARQSRFSET